MIEEVHCVCDHFICTAYCFVIASFRCVSFRNNVGRFTCCFSVFVLTPAIKDCFDFCFVSFHLAHRFEASQLVNSFRKTRLRDVMPLLAAALSGLRDQVPLPAAALLWFTAPGDAFVCAM